ncbi:Hypothetical protein HDN1F_24560 [gamma proteobacterium HdN1]|nr:Hypothetical protein HDN1F_24560 [gamma proteobacterium HdN1]
MKLKVAPTSRETVLGEDDLIISKTDTTGKIIYANRTFMKISQLSEPELLGKQHNVIRHPDMPRGLFKMLWDDLQQGKESFAYVKNICKDGGFYWVLANITHDYDLNDKVTGYYSVRRKPSRASIETVTPIYRKMCEIEAQHSPKQALVHSVAYVQQILKDQQMRDYNDFICSLMKGDGYL